MFSVNPVVDRGEISSNSWTLTSCSVGTKYILFSIGKPLRKRQAEIKPMMNPKRYSYSYLLKNAYD